MWPGWPIKIIYKLPNHYNANNDCYSRSINVKCNLMLPDEKVHVR